MGRKKAGRPGAACCVLLAACALAAPAWALADEAPSAPAAARPWRVLIEEGVSRDANGVRAGIGYEFAPQWHLASWLALTSSLDLTGGWWRVNRNDREDRGNFAQFGLTPSLRIGGPSRTGAFAEIGVGANGIAPRYRSTRAAFSTVYQFGDHFEVGWRASSASAWELALRYEHFSNAGIRHPNPGEGFSQLRLSTAF